jgi:proteasome lid subunit RPN8/RPN11
MSWNELPPDFRTESICQLTSRLGVADVYALLRLAEREESIVLVDTGALADAIKHVSATNVESGGLLVGKTYVSAAEFGERLRHVVAILRCVPADDAEGSSVALRMEPELWTKTNASKPDDQFVVGWFHSHPNLGAFFSGTDRGTQRRFFPESHKIGWVIDPIRKENAWFIGGDSVTVSEKCVFVGKFAQLL